MYQLADSYVCNEISSVYYQDRFRSLDHQAPCYRALRELILTNGYKSVLDLGCGHWVKLYKYVYPAVTDIVGIDLPESIAKNGLAPFGVFFGHDLDQGAFQSDRKFDVIIASDIVEHLANPDNLMLSVKNAIVADHIVLFSTPDRRYQNVRSEGRPFNQSHVREWSEAEFCAYLESSGFDVLFIYRDLMQSFIYFCKVKGS